MYSYVSGRPINFADPSGLVKVNQSIAKPWGSISDLNVYSLDYAEWTTSGSCECIDKQWYARLTLNFTHHYYCGTSCATEYHHAEIAWPFVVKLAQIWKPYEDEPYPNKAICMKAAAFWADDMRKYLFVNAPKQLLKDYTMTQQLFEDTHHEGLCAWLPASLCSAK